VLPQIAEALSVSPMSDRLAELRRQRALIAEHLAWLDREIAAAEKSSPTGVASPVSVGALPVSGAPKIVELPARPAAAPIHVATPMTPVASVTENQADEILGQYRVAPTALKEDLRKGCLLYFVGALVLLGLVVVGLYFALRHN
jgi:hypothetical protein